MKKSIWFAFTMVCLLCSCAADPIIVDHDEIVEDNTRSYSRSIKTEDNTCNIRFAMYEAFDGYTVKVDSVRIIQAPEGIDNCCMDNLTSADHISDNRTCPTFNDHMERFHTFPLPKDTISDVIISYDFTITSEDNSKEVIRISNATFTIPANEIKWTRKGYFTYRIRISADTNGTTDGTTIGLHAITFDVTVAPS